MAFSRKHEWISMTRTCSGETPLDELEDRLEMQRLPATESAVACYADFCPSDCTVLCGAGYSGCTDLCACDGTMCGAECGALCVADSCIVDIL
jgi:hypothetical protein